MYKISALFVGVLISIMVTFNGILADKLGDYFSVFIIHSVGLITVSLILALKKEKITLKSKIPIYLFSAGAIGVFMVFSNNICSNYFGVSLTLSLGLFGQSVASCLIDHFGLLGMEIHKFQKEKLIGFILIFVGIMFMIVY